MPTVNTNYNKYDHVPNFAYNIIEHLFTNEDIWKLLKYDAPDALELPNLTPQQKSNLVWTGELKQDDIGDLIIDMNQYRVFKQPSVEDSFTTTSTQLRVYKETTHPVNRTVGYVIMTIEVLVHNKLNGLDNVEIERLSALEFEIIKSLNGQAIQGLGVMSLNQRQFPTSGSKLGINNNKNYFGSYIRFGVPVGAGDTY